MNGQRCDIRSDNVTESCRTCGMAWSAEDAFPPECPKPAREPGMSTGKRVLVVLFAAALVAQTVLGAVIVYAMFRGCAA